MVSTYTIIPYSKLTLSSFAGKVHQQQQQPASGKWLECRVADLIVQDEWILRVELQKVCNPTPRFQLFWKRPLLTTKGETLTKWQTLRVVDIPNGVASSEGMEFFQHPTLEFTFFPDSIRSMVYYATGRRQIYCFDWSFPAADSSVEVGVLFPSAFDAVSHHDPWKSTKFMFSAFTTARLVEHVQQTEVFGKMDYLSTGGGKRKKKKRAYEEEQEQEERRMVLVAKPERVAAAMKQVTRFMKVTSKFSALQPSFLAHFQDDRTVFTFEVVLDKNYASFRSAVAAEFGDEAVVVDDVDGGVRTQDPPGRVVAEEQEEGVEAGVPVREESVEVATEENEEQEEEEEEA